MLRRPLGLVLTGLIAQAAVAAAPPERPKLIVAISVDQFSAELFNRYRPTFTQGLARIGGGIAFNGYQSHGGTETCPGHSTLLTGRHPAGTGIVANSWYDRATWKSVYCSAVPGEAPDERGTQNLRASTLGEWLKAAEPQARVISVSGKDRSAIMMGGHKADAIYWWEDGKGFVSSRFVVSLTKAVTDQAETFNRQVTQGWAKKPPVLWPTEVSAACHALEGRVMFGKVERTGKVPPEQVAEALAAPDYITTKAFREQLRGSPMLDRLTLEFADSLITKYRLGRGKATDLLAVSFSATDYVGHRYGNGGAEMCAQMAALDATLGEFFARLDKIGVPYVAVLSADHGGSDAAERAKLTNSEAYRLDSSAFRRELSEAVTRATGVADPIAAADVQQIYIKPAAGTPEAERVAQAAITWLKTRPEVVEVYRAAEVAAAMPPKDKPAEKLTLLERLSQSYVADRSGDLFVVFKPYASFGIPNGPTGGVAGHGSPWDYDRRVPILFWWKGVTGESRAEPARTVDIAPTLAAIAGIPVPEIDGTCLSEVAGSCG